MPFIVLAPFYNPSPEFQFASAEEAEAKAIEMVTQAPATVVTTAEVTFLKTFKATVAVSNEAAATE